MWQGNEPIMFCPRVTFGMCTGVTYAMSSTCLLTICEQGSRWCRLEDPAFKVPWAMVF